LEFLRITAIQRHGSQIAGNLKAQTKLKSVGEFLENNPDKFVGSLPVFWVTATAPSVLIDGRTRIQLPSKVANMIATVCWVFWFKSFTVYEYLFQAIGLRMIFGLKKNPHRLVILSIMLLIWFYDALFSKSTNP
jgi:hypothetical protein